MAQITQTLWAAVRRVGIVAAILVFFGVGLAGTVYLSLRSSEVRVPDVVGKHFFAGQTTLEDAHLNIRKRAKRTKPDAAPDTILDQSPRAGEIVKVGQTIAVVVADEQSGKSLKEGAAPEPTPEPRPEADQNAPNTAQNDNQNRNENQNRAARNKNANRNSNRNANNSNANNQNAGGQNANNRNANTNAARNTNANRNANANAANRNANLNANRTNANAARNTNANANRGNTNRNANTNRRPAVNQTPF